MRHKNLRATIEPMKARIRRVVFEADVHNNRDKIRLGFQVPALAGKLLGVTSRGPISLVIRNHKGKLLYKGTRPMTSRYEAYGTDMNLKSGQTVVVEASKP